MVEQGRQHQAFAPRAVVGRRGRAFLEPALGAARPAAPEAVLEATPRLAAPRRAERLVEALAERLAVIRAHARVGDLGDATVDLLPQPGPAFRRGGILPGGEVAPQHVDQRHHGGEPVAHFRRAGARDQAVRVVALGHEGERQRPAGREQRQGAGGGARRRGAARPVAVEAQHRFGGKAPQRGQLVFRQRRAERRDDMLDSGLRQRDDVHVAFRDRHGAGVARGAARAGEVVEHAPLAKGRRLGGVEIFRLRVVQAARAEPDDPAAPVGDREHYPAAEEIARRAAAVGAPDQPGLSRQVVVDPFPRQHRGERPD